jgi:hypothetical protein
MGSDAERRTQNMSENNCRGGYLDIKKELRGEWR